MTGPVASIRPEATHKPAWQRFQSSLIAPSSAVGSIKDAQDHLYMRQYSHVYHQRLSMLGPRCWEAMQHVDAKKVLRILEVAEGVASLLVGTLVRESEGTTLIDGCSPKDKDILYLEDESGRVQLLSNDPYQYCTGFVVGVQGVLREDGVLGVSEVFAPALSSVSTEMARSDGVDPHVLLVSGLNCGDKDASPVPRDMLLSFLQGQFGTAKAKLVSNVVVAGGTISQTCSNRTSALRDANAWLNQVAACGVRVAILPGETDPTTANWPQRPIHSALLPGLLHNVNRVPNPYAAYHAERLLVATDGRNIRDLSKQICKKVDAGSLYMPTEMESLIMTLHFSHICPTGPDSVPTMPHAQADPMVLTERPALYVCGGSKEFQTSLVNGTRLVCVPSFSASRIAVLVNLTTLQTEVLKFEDQ